METPIGDDEDSHLGDFIEDLTIASRLSLRQRKVCGSNREVLGGLTAREAKVLRMRFGIDMNTDHTLEEVGKQFDVTRERIRQIKTTPQLRHPTRSDYLRSSRRVTRSSRRLVLLLTLMGSLISCSDTSHDPASQRHHRRHDRLPL